jgi:hypothetical protein
LGTARKMNNKVWLNEEGKIILDENGKVILC